MKTAVALTSVMLAIWCAFGLLPESTVLQLSVEDGPVENLGAAAFFFGSVLFFAAFLASKGNGNDLFFLQTKRNLFPLLLAVAFLFAAGEEISWGQRVFGWETPAAIVDVNSQDETTIHNLEIFQTGRSFSFWFNAFWFGFCVAVPLADRWRPAHSFFDRIRMPVLPLWTGGVLLINYAMFKFVGSFYESGSELRHAGNELKETTIAVIFVAVAWLVLENERVTRDG